MENISKEACKVINDWIDLSDEDQEDVLDFIYEKLYGRTFKEMSQDRLIKQKSILIRQQSREIKVLKENLSSVTERFNSVNKKVQLCSRHRAALVSLWSNIPKEIRKDYVPENTMREIKRILSISINAAEEEYKTKSKEYETEPGPNKCD